MKFMCSKHRAELSKNPDSAILCWYRLVHAARYQVQTRQWQKAVISYGNALDASEISFASDPSSSEVNRYLRTACELAYTVRRSDYPCDLQLIVAIVKEKIETHLYPANVQLVLRPLVDIAYSPLSEVEHWMKALFEMDKQKSSTVH